jgi:hypothetical protein
VLGLAMVLACAVGDNEEVGTTFDAPTSNSSATATSSSSSSSSGVTSSVDDDDDDSASTTSPASDSGEETMTGAEETSDEVPSEQPMSGMYSACLDAAMCVGQTTCFTIMEGVDIVDGFCTTAPCVDPEMDCDPSPGGTSTPVCHEMMVGTRPTMGCALDCSAGKTCPAGMECYTLAMGQLCV